MQTFPSTEKSGSDFLFFAIMKIKFIGLSLASVPSLESLFCCHVCKGYLSTIFAIHGQVTKWCFLAVFELGDTFQQPSLKAHIGTI